MRVVMGADATAEIGTLIRSTRQVLSIPFDRPIQDHPALSSIAEDFNAWMQETDAGLKKIFYWRENSFTELGVFTGTTKHLLSSVGQTWAKKVLRGVTHWTDYHQVARLTEYYSAPVAAEGCGRGHIGTPASFGGLTPEGYSWLKTADEVIEAQGGQFMRVREWTGINGVWDPDIYGDGED